jgi:hypothetical protein
LQTFLIAPRFSSTAQILDRQRLGKQRVEAIQILRTLTGLSTGWPHHPATKMWRGYERALLDYTWAMIQEWADRGYANAKCMNHYSMLRMALLMHPLVMPPWLDDQLFISHKSNLLRKNEAHYRPYFGPDIPNDLPYHWPV